MYLDFIIRILTCFILSILIGVERQARHRMIGLRTNVLVCLGAFLFVTLSMELTGTDSTRVAAQVVSGIGFLGAGVILRDGVRVKGLNTAATLWCVSAIGVLTASGLLVEAAIGTAFVLLSNIVLRIISKKMMQSSVNKDREDYVVKITCKENKEPLIRSLLVQLVKENNLTLKDLESTDIEDNKIKIKATVLVSKDSIVTIESMINRISLETGTISIGWKLLESPKINNIEEDDEEV